MSDAEVSDRDYRALAQFRRALRTFMRFSEDAARGAGITPAQHQLMLAVRGWSGDAAPSVSDLADALQLQNHSTVELVHRACDAGLVTTIRDARDGRRHLVGLTEHGQQLLASLSATHRRELRTFRTEMARVLDQLD